MPELIAVLLILGVLGAVGASKLINSGFDNARFLNEATSALRYAQSAALSMQRTVCVATNATSVTLTYVPTYGVTSCASTSPLPAPSGAAGAYQVTASGSATFTSGTGTFSFDRAGRPSAAQTLGVSGGSQIFVESETGYVHN